MKNLYKIVSSIEIAVIFFLVALAVNFFADLYNADWDFRAFKVNQLTIWGTLLVFVWQMISEFHAGRLEQSNKKIERLVEELPGLIQNGTKVEVNQLKEDNEKFREELARGVVYHDKHFYRTLTYEKERGTLFNGFGEDNKDRSRNVLFSNKTVNLVFREILRRNNRDLLHDIGKKASERFAYEMVKNIQDKSIKAPIDFTKWIEEWIKFDSDAGFGKFELEGRREEWRNSMVILLKFSFLTQDYRDSLEVDKTKNLGICSFMTGYLEGILNSFPPDILQHYELIPNRVYVKHNLDDPEDCIGAGRADHKGCRFHITKEKK